MSKAIYSDLVRFPKDNVEYYTALMIYPRTIFFETISDIIPNSLPDLYEMVYPHFLNTDHTKVFMFQKSCNDPWEIRFPKAKDSVPRLLSSLEEWSAQVGLQKKCWKPWVQAVILDTLVLWKRENVSIEKAKWWFEIEPPNIRKLDFIITFPTPDKDQFERNLDQYIEEAYEQYRDPTCFLPCGRKKVHRPIIHEHMKWFIRNWVLNESQPIIQANVGKSVTLPIRDVALSLNFE